MMVSSDNVKSILMIGATAFIVWKLYQAGKAVGAATEAVAETISTTLNPASDQNFIYRGTQQAGDSFGKYLYELTH